MDEKEIKKEAEKILKKEEKQKEKRNSNKEIEALQEQVQKALTTAAHHQNLSNYYKNEYDKMIKYKSQDLIENLLPSLDSFEFAFKTEAKTEEAKSYKAGFEFIYKMLIKTLEDEGLEILSPSVNEEFNSDSMQIVEVVEVEEKEKENKISQVMLNGYKLKDRLIRPASVKVYTLKKENENTTNEENKNLN